MKNKSKSIIKLWKHLHLNVEKKIVSEWRVERIKKNRKDWWYRLIEVNEGG